MPPAAASPPATPSPPGPRARALGANAVCPSAVCRRTMADFVARQSVVRTIWADPDAVLLVFAGSAAEFALNRAVDWLFFTNRIPGDPLGRLFSTVGYAQGIVFASEVGAQQALQGISAAHGAVERRRGQTIPEWAYRDVLYMLLDYSRRAYELLHRPLGEAEQGELFAQFMRLGEGLAIPGLPRTLQAWRQDRLRHLERDLAFTEHTARLYGSYRAHLGPWRYRLLLDVQGLLVPERVQALLKLRHNGLLAASMRTYPLFRRGGLLPLVRRALIPPRYWQDVGRLGAVSA